jgi:hypothetical protein
MPDLLEQLAEFEVPPVPREFDTRLQERVNRGLLVGQAFELVLKAIPYTVLHFAGAVWGLVLYSVTGRYGHERRDDKPM